MDGSLHLFSLYWKIVSDDILYNTSMSIICIIIPFGEGGQGERWNESEFSDASILDGHKTALNSHYSL
jgi:hypothetical protein